MKRRFGIPHLTKIKEEGSNVYGVDWTTKHVEKKSVKHYAGNIKMIADLTACEILLMYYLTDVMDEGNLIRNTKELKKDFNQMVGRKFSDTSINRGFRRLKQKQLLIKLNKKARGFYKVNPRFFFDGEEPERKKSIRRDYESSFMPEINRYRAETFDVDKAKKEKKRNDRRRDQNRNSESDI